MRNVSQNKWHISCKKKNHVILGEEGEISVIKKLRRSGFIVKRMPRKAPFDLLVSGQLRIEVKTGAMRIVKNLPCWTFNLHRHAILKENYDFYIFCLKVPFYDPPVYLLSKAPLKKKVQNLSFRSLLGKHAYLSSNFSHFLDGNLHLIS